MYFDTTYVVRLYVNEPGCAEVRRLAATGRVVCSILGQAEAFAAFHRKFREGFLAEDDFRLASDRFAADCERGAFEWLPISSSLLERLRGLYASLPSNTFLRSADALHL